MVACRFCTQPPRVSGCQDESQAELRAEGAGTHEENSHVGMAVAPVAAGHVPPVHFGRHMQPPNGNFAGTARTTARGSGEPEERSEGENGDGAKKRSILCKVRRGSQHSLLLAGQPPLRGSS